MKKFLSIVGMIAAACALLVGCTTVPPDDHVDPDGGKGTAPDGYEYVSMLTDRKFEKGFFLRGLGKSIYGDPVERFEDEKTDPTPPVYFQYGKEGVPKPDWGLAQWASRYSFRDVGNIAQGLDGKIDYSFTALSEGVYNYTNSSKSITVDTNTGEYSLGLKASECYKYPREYGQEWPHWFIMRDIYNVPNPPVQCSVAKSYGINLRFDIRLNSFADCMGAAANPNLHSVIFPFYIHVANIDPKTKMQTDFLYVGLMPFDNRYVLSSKSSRADTAGNKGTATNKWVLNVATADYFTLDYNLKTPDNEPILNEWRSVDIDVLGYIDEALASAQKAGYMKTAKWENLYINHMYFGYESPGTYDIDMSCKNVDIVSLLKKEDIPQ